MELCYRGKEGELQGFLYPMLQVVYSYYRELFSRYKIDHLQTRVYKDCTLVLKEVS